MKLSQKKTDLTYEKIEIEKNKIFSFLVKFWQFSKFHGAYLASLHSKTNN